MLSIAESLSWAELKHRSTPITKRCLPSMSIMIRLPLVLRYRTYVIVIFFNFKWIQFASGQFKLYKTSWCARYHTEFKVHDFYLNYFQNLYLFWQFSYQIQIDDVFVLLPKTQNAAIRGQNGQNYHVSWHLMVIGGIRGVMFGNITDLITVFVIK